MVITITLGLTIEQSDNLIEWTKLDGEMTRTIPIPDGKKFYRLLWISDHQPPLTVHGTRGRWAGGRLIVIL